MRLTLVVQRQPLAVNSPLLNLLCLLLTGLSLHLLHLNGVGLASAHVQLVVAHAKGEDALVDTKARYIEDEILKKTGHMEEERQHKEIAGASHVIDSLWSTMPSNKVQLRRVQYIQIHFYKLVVNPCQAGQCVAAIIGPTDDKERLKNQPK